MVCILLFILTHHLRNSDEYVTGVVSQAFHFWDGPGRRGDDDPENVGKDARNFYENYAEDTKGKRKVIAEVTNE
jgi:hypothetical protein